MEQESQVREPATSLGEIELPVITALNCASTEAAGKLGPHLLKAIADRTSPEVIAPLFNGMRDINKNSLEVLLSNPQVHQETLFWEEARKMVLIVESGAVEELQEEETDVIGDVDDSMYLATLYSKQPHRLMKILQHVIEGRTGDVRGKSFHIFASSLPVHATKQRLELVTTENFLSALRSPFEKRRYGTKPRLNRIGGDGIWGLLINRGNRRSPEAIYNAEENPEVNFGRKAKSDFLFYLEEANALMVSTSSKTDAPMYAEAIGHVMEGRNVFATKVQGDLSIFLQRTLAQDLGNVARALNIPRIELRKLHVELATGGESKYRVNRRVECYTENYPTLDVIDPKNKMKSVQLRLGYDATGKDFADIDITQGTIKLKGRISPATANTVMTLLKVWGKYKDA